MQNQNAFGGQLIGGTVTVEQNFNMTFKPVIFPGANITQFAENIAYIREVARS